MNLSNNSLKMNAMLNMFRRGSAILFPIITFSYASHKLGASGMGAFSFCNSVISYFLLFAALGIGTYAVREGQEVRDDKIELQRFVSEVYTINIITTIVSYILLAILVAVWSKLNGYREIIFLLSISIAMTTIGADWINTLLEDYLYITVRYIAIQILCLIMLVLLVKEPGDIYKYALISAIASVGGNLLNVWYIRRRIHFHITRKPRIKKHIIPMLTLFSNNLAIQIYLIADITMLGIFLADKYVGYYSVSAKVYTSVKEVINAMILVTIPRFSYYLSHGDIENYRKSFNEVVSAAVTLLFPCIAGLIFQARNIVYYLGGPEYVAGEKSLQILAIAMFFAVAASLVAHSVLIPNKMERIFLISTIVAALLNIILNILLIPKLGIEAAAITTLISESVVLVMMICMSKSVRPKMNIKNSDIPSSIIGSVFVIAICKATAAIIDDKLLNMIVSVVVSACVYFLVVYAMSNHTIRSLLNKEKV